MTSFLRANGLHDADEYPLWRIIDEAEMANARINRQWHTHAVVTQAASAASQHKKAFGPFKKLLETLLP